jgi:hypothetical protein
MDYGAGTVPQTVLVGRFYMLKVTISGSRLEVISDPGEA